ncbi:MAG: KUP/HAK/KT family potassium transporter [Bacteroidia bacterium]|nr:KUP/HAK/KT family potassium transporter [Bacteroidia bacterium]
MKTTKISKLSFMGVIITLGIVYGDIGTSPLYVFRAIVNGSGGASYETVLGGLSCIIWTLTLQTTLKYILITLRADNKGEGGIFALYALIRRHFKWIFIFAIIGGCTLLSDGIITPAITVVSAVEGLRFINDGIPVLPIALLIIFVLFFIQQFGTNSLGKSFGPIMFFWFLMLGILGFSHIIHNPVVLKAFNPYYAYQLLAHHPGGFLLLGAIFLCTTGADALYSDLGHCGYRNIRVSWIYVKTTLILNYLGQGAWILLQQQQNIPIAADVNPFFASMPQWFLLPGILISTAAAIIASQAMISGSYTIINEAILLNFWPRVKISHPTSIKGQMYIPSVNKFLCIACICVILFLRESSNMEAAYGLAITITMLMTTTLMTFYLYIKRKPLFIIFIFLLSYLTIEISFLIANLFKFIHGGWVTLFIAGILFFIMFVWYKGRAIKNRFTEYINIDKYFNLLKDLKQDETVPKHATNLVYITRANVTHEVESKIIYSIINKDPKRADVYWLIHVDVTDEPHTMTYRVTPLIPGTLIRIDFQIGFRVPTKINQYFRHAVEGLVTNKEVDISSRYASLKKHDIHGDFRFVLIDRVQGFDFEFPVIEQFIMDSYDVLKNIGISDEKAYGLDTSNVVTEKVPLIVTRGRESKMSRLLD